MAQEGRDEKGRFTEKNLFALLRERVGRPMKFLTPEDLAHKAIDYFQWCHDTKNKVTYAGLRSFIGMNRMDWHNYKHRDDYADTMYQIELLLEAEWESRLTWAGSTQGAIFWLKNKAGWKDEVTQNQNQTVTTVQPKVVDSGTPLASDEKQITG